MGMDHILGSELAKAVVELHPLTKVEGPFFQIRADLPLFRQARCVLPCLGIEVKQRFQKGVVLQMLGTGNGPEAVALGEPSGTEDNTLVLGLRQCRRWRGREDES